MPEKSVRATRTREEVPALLRVVRRPLLPPTRTGAPEGSLDLESFEALIRVLSEHSPMETRLAATSSSATALRLRISNTPTSGKARWHPSRAWPSTGADRTLAEQLPAPDHRWFVWADLDLEGTKVSGDPQLTQALGRDYFLEYLDRRPPATVTT